MELFNDRLNMVVDILKRYDNILEVYDHIVSNCQKTLMSKDKKMSMYGMFLPDKEMEYCVLKYEGKLTTNANRKDYKYYFDEEDRVILTERYSEHKIQYYIFYFYKEDCVEIVWYHYNHKKISVVAKIQYCNGLIHSYFETFEFRRSARPETLGNSLGFVEYTYNYTNDKVELLYKSRLMLPNGELDIRSKIEQYRRMS